MTLPTRRRPLVLAAAVLGLVMAGPARAQEAGPRPDLAAEADLHFQIGVEHYRAQRWREALEHLLQSNRLAPNRNVVFNIARCYEKLGDYEQAWRHYDDYTAVETDPEYRASGEAALERIADKVALVEIQTVPAGATVYVDRRNLGVRGTTPLTLALPPGPHTLILDAEGHQPSRVKTQAVRGESVPATANLDPILGTLQLRGAPVGAQVRLDGPDAPVIGTLPVELRLPPGPHILVFDAERHQTLRLPVSVEADTSLPIDVNLEVATGSLVVEAVERGARIDVDGRAVGFTPAVVDVPAGPHTVQVQLPGYRTYTEEVTVEADQSRTVEVRLRSRQEVTAATRTTLDVERAPASVSIIDAREIRAFGYQSLYDAVAGTRGVFQTNDLTYGYVGVRGFARLGDYGNRLLVTVDGHTMNDDQLGASYVGNDFLADLHDVAQVEVVRGPGSALYGTNAFFGVLNVVTRDVSQPGGHVVVTADGVRTMRGRAAVDLGDPDRGITLSAAGVVRQGDDYRFPEYAQSGPGADPDAAWSRGADGSESVTAHARAWAGDLTVQGLLTSRDQRIATGAFATELADPRATSDDTRGFVELRYEPRLGDRGQLYGRAWVDRYAFDGVYPYEDNYVYRDRWRGTWVGAEPRFVLQATDAIEITAGSEVRQHVQAELRSRDNEDGVLLDEEPTQGVYAAYGLARIQVVKRLRADLGARYDHFTLQGVGGAFNPRAALILDVGENDVIKLLSGTAFRTPSPYEWFYNDGGITQQPAQSLGPERIFTTELEATHRFDDVTTATAAVYVNQITNLVITESVDDPVAAAEGVFRYGNSGAEVQSAGFEAEVRRDWRRGWMVQAQQALQTTRTGTLLEGQPITNSPLWAGSVKLAAPLPASAATLASRLRAESPRRITNAAFDPETDLTPWAVLWDVTVSGPVASGPLTLSGGVRNLLDWQVEHPGGVDLQQRVVPQPGRTVFASARVDI